MHITSFEVRTNGLVDIRRTLWLISLSGGKEILGSFAPRWPEDIRRAPYQLNFHPYSQSSDTGTWVPDGVIFFDVGDLISMQGRGMLPRNENDPFLHTLPKPDAPKEPDPVDSALQRRKIELVEKLIKEGVLEAHPCAGDPLAQRHFRMAP